MNFPKNTLLGNVTRLGYNIIELKLENFNKLIYIHKFPPATDTTTVPDLSTDSDLDELKSDKFLKKKTLIDFWASTDKTQANGDWKGGEWGSNNLATTDTNWCTGIFIGDPVEIKIIKQGIIPYKTRLSKPFEFADEIISGSEQITWSCNIILDVKGNKSISSGYVCDKPMEQLAIDVLFVWKNSRSERFVKILRRGSSNKNVDMPGLLMPGAGEHREPGNNVSFKSEVVRAVREEIGLPDSTISECYLLSIGLFDENKRDPRYWTFTADQDNQIIEFGIKRKSSTDVYVLYIESDTDNVPVESEPIDNIEVNKKQWVRLDDPTLSNNQIYMIPEHSLYFSNCVKILNRFDSLSIEHKICKKIMLN